MTLYVISGNLICATCYMMLFYVAFLLVFANLDFILRTESHKISGKIPKIKEYMCQVTRDEEVTSE